MRSLLTFLALIAAANCAPSTEKTVAVHDQRQSGDYNIQVHLKDFQIVAIFGEDTVGDYDYNYDYSDFTIKPPGGNVTLKPPPEDGNATTTPEAASSTTEKPETTSPTPTTTKAEPEKTTPTTTTAKAEPPFSTSSPDRIKVQIIEEASPNVEIVPLDDMGSSNTPQLGEVLHYRRCATGYARDKRGRCRRVRRPAHQHQFDIGKLASNLAAKFRGMSSEEGSVGDSR